MMPLTYLLCISPINLSPHAPPPPPPHLLEEVERVWEAVKVVTEVALHLGLVLARQGCLFFLLWFFSPTEEFTFLVNLWQENDKGLE